MRTSPKEVIIYLGPGLLTLTLFILVPLFSIFMISFINWDVFSGIYKFAAFDNYRAMINNPMFYTALNNTIIYVTATVLISMAFALFIAVIVNKQSKYLSFYRISIFSPVIISLAASGIIWTWIYDYNNGILNRLFSYIGISGINWLGNPKTALLSVITMTIWKRTGYNMVIFLAGLQVIPKQLYEAARIDGANEINQFKYVTWPNLMPTTFFIFVTNLIFSFRDFAHIHVMTGGGPLGKTTTLVYYIYESAFKEFELGHAAAASVILFIFVIIVTFLKIRYMKRGLHEI